MVEINFIIPIGIGSVDVVKFNVPVAKFLGNFLTSNVEPILAGDLVS